MSEQRNTRLLRRVAVAVLVVLTLLGLAAATVAFLQRHENSRQQTQTGSFTGTYVVQFATATMPNGLPYENAPGGRETWVIKSSCRGAVCVATGSKVGGTQSGATTLVFDNIGGRWMAVSAMLGTCQNATTEFWETMSLQQRSDGTLEGEFIVWSTTSCGRNQQVTFTRTGDVEDGVVVAEPAAQLPRVASPAQGLHGRYQETDTYAAGQSAQTHFAIQSYCLRTGQRCLSSWQNPEETKILLFTKDKWVVTHISGEVQCRSGARGQREISLEYALPQPALDPIPLLTGRGRYAVTGDCPYSSDFASRVERTGD